MAELQSGVLWPCWGAGKRWRTVDGGLEEAKAAQASLAVRKNRGERIEPTRLTFEQAATRWLDAKVRLRPKTRIGYEGALRNHLLPAIGRKLIHEVTEDDLARLIRDLEAKGLRPWSIRGQALTPLSGIFRHAVRKGWRTDNPVRNLETDEKPELEPREKRILEPMRSASCWPRRPTSIGRSSKPRCSPGSASASC